MLYHLTQALIPYMSELDVFRYHTVRAGGAAITGFLFCLLVGPRLIALLRALKVGQIIKKDHVADLHALHKGKAGTPTMGGVIIILSTVLSLLLWSTLTNRLLWVAVGVLVLLGAVGFLDDFIKLKRKHNDGLSARAKFFGQILTGGLLGLYLYFNPITLGDMWVGPRDIEDWNLLTKTLVAAENQPVDSPGGRIWSSLDHELQSVLKLSESVEFLPVDYRIPVLVSMNAALNQGHWADNFPVAEAAMDTEKKRLLETTFDDLDDVDKVRHNRLVLEASMPGVIAKSISNMHTRVGVPGFKDVLIPLGPLYILFVIFIIVSVSNAVNLTDGLDGLAAGTSVVSIFTFAAIAYVVSRADWSYYLYLTHIPEASELFVFGAALLGTGLGFLWFNAHPAEVFMGDTGSLALGGAIATMAILTKQELLLPIVAGLFVMEAGSVVIQVASFKMTGKRVFRMAPLHHHFELLGWTETKVTVRFWIIAFLFSLMSFATLKLR
jgi:UDP-N-acetylmuramyl pentapeptide phosphotransferase/UDP-N-acetylglucosamine-1-phosphate transferase